MKTSVLTFAAFLLAGPLFAADYHVAPSGADNNSGTAAAPFATIQKAADIIKPGDTINVAPGTYKGAAFYGSAENVAGPLAPITGWTEIRITLQIPNELIDRIFPKK